MKRGLIAWDRNEIPPAVFEQRVQLVREYMAQEGLPAVVVYSELWRSNQARFFANYMPYFNRALLVLPFEGASTLFCGLSPRVYSWIRSVTTIEDIRPAGNFVRPLFQLAAERQWRRLGVMDLEQLPYDLHSALRGGELEVTNVPGDTVFLPGGDENEISMRRKALTLAREILEEEIPKGLGRIDHHFVGAVEGRLRRAGVEDVLVLITNGDGPPAPAKGATLAENFSVSLAVEYRGHWIRLSRPHGSAELIARCHKEFLDRTTPGPSFAKEGNTPVREILSGSYPFEIGTGSIFAIHIQIEHHGKLVFYGDAIL